MGGLAFSKSDGSGPALAVPRMNSAQYSYLKAHCHSILLQHYSHVRTPAEAPGKEDFGDIDFLVACEPDHSLPSSEAVAAAVGADHQIRNGVCTSFAVPWPEKLYQLHDNGATAGSHPGVPRIFYAQVDTHVCPPELLDWMAFRQAYGDLWQTLGHIIRPYGFTVDESGFHVHVPELENLDRKKSKVLLSSTPGDVIAFLHLNAARYAEGFDTQDALFEWIAQCRFFGPDVLCQVREKSKDRQRMRKRQMFKRFIEEWAPARFPTSQPDGDSDTLTTRGSDEAQPTLIFGSRRAAVMEEALDRFHQRSTYEAVTRQHEIEMSEKEFWSEVAASLPLSGDHLRQAIRGFKRYVHFVAGQPEIRDEAELDDAKCPMWTLSSTLNKGGLLQWVNGNWETIYRTEKGRAKAWKEVRKEKGGMRSG